jgi:peroxiredoxin
MLIRALGLVALLLITVVAAGDEPLRSPKIEDFALPDFRGKQHRLADFADQPLVVVAFLGTECPLAKLYGPRLAQLAAKYELQGVAFIGVNSNQQDSLTEIAGYARQHGIEFPLLKDLENKLADRFGAQRTPEVFVLDRERIVRYRGRIDDQWGIGYVRDQPKQYDLQAALDQLLAGKDVAVAATEPVGCLIGRIQKPHAGGSVTYGGQIATLLQKRCVECHRAGDIGPFSLTSYEEAVGWASMIQEVVDGGRMPPWHANPKYGHFSEDRRLSDEEKSLIRQWVEAGAPPGDLSHAPPLSENPVEWQLRRPPDLVLNMREQPYEVPATGEVRYQYFVVDPKFTEDKWIDAGEILPGNRSVVHHILVHARTGTDRRDLTREAGGGFLTGYVPGLRAKPLPAGMAKRIPASSKLVFQVHYTPNGTKQLDQSKIGLWFADEKTIHHEVKTLPCATRRLEIPPHDSNYKTEADLRLPVDALLISMSPHMHLRGKSFRYDAIFPGGKDETLLDVPRYDFNWQTVYRLTEPLQLPAGTRIRCVAHYDNSENNLSNPDPSKTVRWGDQTWEEMMIGYFDVAITREVADKINEHEDAASHPAAGQELTRQALMLLLDRNRDGKISKDEAPERLKAAFELLDRDKNGELTEEELPASIRRP